MISRFQLYSDHESLAHFASKQSELKKRDCGGKKSWEIIHMIIFIDQPGPTMYVPDAISRAFKQESVPHETGVLAAIESIRKTTDGSA